MTRRYIAVTADIFEHSAFADEPYSRRDAWLWLIANAAWKAHRVRMGNKMVEIERGQVVAGREHLAAIWGWGEKKVRLFLDFLTSENMIEKGQSRGRLANVVTICKYEQFQTGKAIEGPIEGPVQGRFRAGSGPYSTKDTKITNNNPLTPLQGEQAGQDQDLALPLEAKEPEPASAAPAEPKRKRQRPPSGPKSYPIEFEAVWQVYPRAGRNEKKSAFDAWNALSDADKAALPSWIKRLEAKLAGAGFDRRPKDMHRWLAKSLDDYRDADAEAAEAGQTVDPYAHLRSANEMQWRIRIKTHANGSWPATELGPPPCSKSCLVPRHIIEELGLSDAYSPAGLATNTHDPRHPIHWHKSEIAA